MSDNSCQDTLCSHYCREGSSLYCMFAGHDPCPGESGGIKITKEDDEALLKAVDDEESCFAENSAKDSTPDTKIVIEDNRYCKAACANRLMCVIHVAVNTCRSKSFFPPIESRFEPIHPAYKAAHETHARYQITLVCHAYVSQFKTLKS